ncbi:hypothetical protein BJF83_24770 [Nocardiopsis sp. CNR-923]|uniref:hypothetical protein n=1 Tax=Nocardiopsis sp. CNR-923 TaxID=1904965 RepID=UPI00096A0869|nr:hypothetical protein [Nocardiopsis sp. CNR-923]OLT30469.1 hypothetical protein BJF83_24770 [Nocardiopsis sp. CNR-923]
MIVSLETQWYWPPEPPEEPVVLACVYESVFAEEQCGRPLPDGADPDDLFCSRHLKAASVGAISWEEVFAYRAHYQV